MQVERTVSLAPVQVDRHTDNRDVRRYQRSQQDLPPGKGKQAVREECERSTEQVGLLSTTT
jgi:hypothetical protein